MDSLRVSLDRAACQGDCVCELICSEVFLLDEDGIAFVRSSNGELPHPSESEQWVDVDDRFAEKVVEAAEECPTNAIDVRRGPVS